MRKLVLLGLMLVAVAFVASCVKPNQAEKDKTALLGVVEKESTYFAGGTKGDSSDGYCLVDDTMVGLWWRGPQTHDPTPQCSVVVSGDSGWVGWSQHNYGTLIHWVMVDSVHAEKWTKVLQEAVQLNAIFRREGQVSETDRGWRLKSISLVMGRSDTVNTVRIDSLRIHTSLRDTLIVDPLNTYYAIDSFYWFTPAEQVTLTLYTNQADGYASLHAFVGLILWRFPFQNLGKGAYQGTWNAQLIQGFRFAIFDFVSRGTLLDPAAPYDFSGWLFPYLVKHAD